MLVQAGGELDGRLMPAVCTEPLHLHRDGGGASQVLAAGEISSDLDRLSLCDIEKSSFKCFEIGLKTILPTQVHTKRITKTLLGHLPDL